MIKYVILVFAIAVSILETTWLNNILILGARPDLVLIILTFYAHRYGVQRGQIGGFLVGIVEDSLSAAPLGFFALVRLAHSAVLGLTMGNVSRDAIVTPILLVVIAGLINFVATLVLTGIFSIEGLYAQLFRIETLIGFVLTILFAPLLFFLLGRFVDRYESRRYENR